MFRASVDQTDLPDVQELTYLYSYRNILLGHAAKKTTILCGLHLSAEN